MELFIKQATILASNSGHHQKKVDIHIQNGKIARIHHKLTVPQNVQVVTGKQLYCTSGLVDIGTHTGEPGREDRETLSTLSKAARAGGYTTILPFPNTLPYVQTKADIHYLIEKGNALGLKIFPIGALSKDGKGEDIAEYYDMFTAGAVAFSDGLKPTQNAGLLLRALQYVTAFDGVVINHPHDKNLDNKGQMHEGLLSTMLGMKGVPTIAELVMLQRDLLLFQYSGSKLVVHAVSSKESIDLLMKEKKNKKNIFVTVPYLNLLCDEKNVDNFNVSFKVEPVLRSETDKKALIKGLSSGTIDAVISNHFPIEDDGKNVEFPYADSGAGGIETAFRATLDTLGIHMDLAFLVSRFNEAPRSIFGLPVPTIEEGAFADLCLFDMASPSVFEKSYSVSNNNPFLGKTFQTTVVASILGEDVFLANERPE